MNFQNSNTGVQVAIPMCNSDLYFLMLHHHPLLFALRVGTFILTGCILLSLLDYSPVKLILPVAFD